MIGVDISELKTIPAGERVLLLPHCLRHSNTCKAKYSSDGLECVECNPECAVNCLRSAAIKLGYKGVCVAPGGRLAVNYINNKRPKAIVAVACDKELEEGIGNVNGIAKDDYAPIIVIIPLSRDGCVDTEVDVKAALETINAGYSATKMGESR
jgi:hypothetical protein